MSDEGFRGRLLVLGGRGMLGRAVAFAAREAKYQVWVSGSEHDVGSLRSMAILEDSIHPHYVVNCAGIVPQRLKARMPAEMVRANAYGPWVVREAFPFARMIQVSTDCVFSGRTPGLRTVADPPDPIDLYGRSKMMGEVVGAVVVRTSFIGPDHGLLKWFLNQPNGSRVEGWTKAAWSGGTVYDVARALVTMLTVDPGIYHMAALPTTKYNILELLREMFNKDVTIVPVDKPVIYRALAPTCSMDRNLESLRPHAVAV